MTADAFSEIETAAACQAEFVDLYRKYLPVETTGSYERAVDAANQIDDALKLWEGKLGRVAWELCIEAHRIVRAEMAGEELT